MYNMQDFLFFLKSAPHPSLSLLTPPSHSSPLPLTPLTPHPSLSLLTPPSHSFHGSTLHSEQLNEIL